MFGADADSNPETPNLPLNTPSPIRVLLVDALCLAYRSFHAIPALSTSSGRPTNAVLGFVKTLQQARRLWQPTHGLVAFDGGQDDRKAALLPAYKAQRPPMPDDLKSQLPELESYLDAAGIPHVRLAAREADDVLAAAATRAREAGAEVLILSSDKDILQLVEEHVSVILPSKADARLGPNEVREKLGVAPSQVPDLLALTGDASDNIPGVRGVGPKTAARWLKAYGSIQGLWQHVNEVDPERFREPLRLARPEVERNLDLVRLDRALTLPLDLPELLLPPADPARLAAFFQRLEFHAMLKDLAQPDLFGPA